MSLTPFERRLWRAALQPCALLTLPEAVEAIPDGDPMWLKRQVAPVGTSPTGHPLWRWGDIAAALGASQDGRGPSVLISHAEAIRRLGTSPHTIREAMRATPKGFEAWTNISAGKNRPTYRWRADALESWWRRVEEWRASSSGETASTSVGGKQGDNGRAASRRKRSPGGAPRPSTRASTRAHRSEPQTAKALVQGWASESCAPNT